MINSMIRMIKFRMIILIKFMGARVEYVFGIGCTAICPPPHAFKQYPSHTPAYRDVDDEYDEDEEDKKMRKATRVKHWRESSRQKWSRWPQIFRPHIKSKCDHSIIEGVIIPPPSC